MNTFLNKFPFYDWVAEHVIQLGITVFIIVLYIVFDRLSTPRLEEGADESRIKSKALIRTIRIARLITGLVGLLVLILVWGIEVQLLFVFASTAITFVGVALFAGWSLLSNITAHFILLLNPCFKRGTFIRIVDADNYAEGYISDMGLFSTKLVTEAREEIVYPNNLLLARTVLVSPRNRLNGVGKLPAFQPASSDAIVPLETQI